jgi:hypothetical protein
MTNIKRVATAYPFGKLRAGLKLRPFKPTSAGDPPISCNIEDSHGMDD